MVALLPVTSVLATAYEVLEAREAEAECSTTGVPSPFSIDPSEPSGNRSAPFSAIASTYGIDGIDARQLNTRSASKSLASTT